MASYYLIATAEASSNLARFDGVRYGLRTEHSEDLYEMYVRTRSEGFGVEVKRRIMIGTYALSAGYYDAYYAQAQRTRTLIINDFAQAFERFDYLVSPVSPRFFILALAWARRASFIAGLSRSMSALAGRGSPPR